MIKGSIVAIVTPMTAAGEVDFAALAALVEWHIAEGTDGIVAVGTTGESATLSVDEHIAVVAKVIEVSAKRVPVLAGTGANSTVEAIELTQLAKAAGADAALIVTPYYNKPPQEGLYRHFKAIADAVDMPHILYNVPGRTACDLNNDTVLRLAEIPNIIGIKDATGNIERGSDLLLRAPKDFAVYSGDDASGLALMLLGGHGVISVTANVAPRLMHEMCVAAFADDLKSAREINNKLLGLHSKLFVEANPIPVKWAVAQMGLVGEGIRLPLTTLSVGNHEIVRKAMQQAGIGN